eukprot:450741-Amphidinium_carterae.1
MFSSYSGTTPIGTWVVTKVFFQAQCCIAPSLPLLLVALQSSSSALVHTMSVQVRCCVCNAVGMKSPSALEVDGS